MDDRISSAIDLGRKNAEIIALTHAHCRNVRVIRSRLMGDSMVEEMTGLPISGRTFSCPFAAHRAGESVNLELIAADFYRENCVACEHREPTGVPNLATYVAEIDSRRREDEETHQQVLRQAMEAREARRMRRAELMNSESQVARDFVALIDNLDAVSPVTSEGRKLVSIAKAVPREISSTRTIEVLLETARVTAISEVVQALLWLCRMGELEPSRLIAVAVDILNREPHRLAAQVIAEYPTEVDVSTIGSMVRSLVVLAHRPRGWLTERMPGGRAPYGEALRAVSAIDLVVVLEKISEMLNDTSDWVRECAADGAAEVFSIEPGTIPVLSRELVRALDKPGALEDEGSGHSSAIAIVDALEVALLADPEEASRAVESEAPRLGDEARAKLFDVYDGPIRNRIFPPPGTEREIPSDVGEIIVTSCLRRIEGDWGSDSTISASNALEVVARYQPQLLGGKLADLIGTLIHLIEKYSAPQAASPTSDVTGLEQLEQSNQKLREWRTIHDLKEVVCQVGSRDPQAAIEYATPLLAEVEIAEEAIQETRRAMMLLLGSIGEDSRFLPRIIPHLYSALLSNDQMMRATAIEAWGRLAKKDSTRRLPRELDELVPQLLADPYVVVHGRMVRELAFGLPVPDDLVEIVCARCMVIALAHQNDMYSHELEHAVEVTVHLARRLDSPLRASLVRQCLVLALGLHPFTLARLLEWWHADLADAENYPEAIMRVLSSPEYIFEPNSRDEVLLRTLRDSAPMLNEVQRASVISTSAAYRTDLPIQALRFAEVLQVAGDWSSAAQLCRDVARGIPDTEEKRIQYTLGACVCLAVEVECLISRGDIEGAERVLREWAEAEQRYQEARANSERSLPWRR